MSLGHLLPIRLLTEWASKRQSHDQDVVYRPTNSSLTRSRSARQNETQSPPQYASSTAPFPRPPPSVKLRMSGRCPAGLVRGRRRRFYVGVTERELDCLVSVRNRPRMCWMRVRTGMRRSSWSLVKETNSCKRRFGAYNVACKWE